MIDPVELTQKLVRCPSITPLDAGALDVVVGTLEPMGFQVTRLRFQQEGSEPVDNIFARLGTEGSHLCFLGHTDVVPTGREEEWTHPPFAAEIADGKLYGRGTADMKGGVAAFVAAVSRFVAQNGVFKGSISLLITGDEEGMSVNGTIKVVEWMQQNGQIPDVALVGEPSNPHKMGEVIKVGRRGTWNGRLKVRGVQGHSAYPEKADNPVPKLVAMLHMLAQHKLDDGNEFFPPSHLVLSSVDVGNKAFNVIPASAEAMINIRYNNLWTPETLEAHIRSLLDQTGYSYDLDCWSFYTSFLAKGSEWRDMVASAVRDVSGLDPEFTTGGGASDACHIAPFCPVVEYGVVNHSIHKVDEYVKLGDLEELTETYLLVLRKYFSIQND